MPKNRTNIALAASGVGLAASFWLYRRLQPELYIRQQIRRQYARLNYSGKRELDFSPFETALAQIGLTRLAQLEAILATAGATQIMSLLETGEVTSVELVLYYVNQIRQRDVNQLNSVITLNPAALELAAELDEERKAGRERGRLHGLPILLKDNIATGDDMPNTAGAKILENSRADRDAFIVTRLRAAGAVILGKANLSEWANFMTPKSANGFSVLGGQTRNPHGRFEVGGSSSGSAVAVAAGFAPVTIGTETAGSLIYPAYHNGVVTLKPSIGLVSRDRIIPISSAQDTAGPMARNMADIAALMSVIAIYDSTDPLAENAKDLDGVDFTEFLHQGGLRGLKIGLIKAQEARLGNGRFRKLAIKQLRAAGAEVKYLGRGPKVDIKFLDMLLHGIQHDLAAYFATIGEKQATSLQDVIDYNRADLKNRAPRGQGYFEQALKLSLTADEYQRKASHNRAKGQQILADFMRRHDVQMLATVEADCSYLYAAAGCPALCVPLSFRKSGEPVGLTFIGNYLEDGLLIRAAGGFMDYRSS